ncbi:right-handed parallel beta-helix repeat-containing protein, partial [Rhizobiaceae sp. 2RAB30]
DHPNVIVRNCRINMADAYVGVENRIGRAGLLVEDCTIFTGGRGLPGASGLWIADGDIVRRCDISGVENGMFFSGDGAKILGNYIHDLGSTAEDPHIDGLQCTGNCSNVLIDGNFIDPYDTSCIIMQNEFGGYSGTVTITNNWLQGRVSYTIYLRGDKGGGTWGAAASVIGNVIGPPAYGYLDRTMGPSSLTWTENIGPNGSSVE